jgi:hypothetical protein
VGVLRTSMVWKSKSAVLHFVTAGADVFAPVHDVDNGFRVAQGIGADQKGSPSNIRLQPSATMASWAAAVETQTLGCDKRRTNDRAVAPGSPQRDCSGPIDPQPVEEFTWPSCATCPAV